MITIIKIILIDVLHLCLLNYIGELKYIDNRPLSDLGGDVIYSFLEALRW